MHAHPSSRSAGRPPVRSMALTWASAVVPGLAHWVAGRRRSAVVIFSLALALLIGIVVLALTTSRTELLRMAVRPGWLTIVIVVALAVALQLATYLGPVAAVVKVVELDAREWLLVAGCAAIPAVAGQLGKLLGARAGLTTP